MSSSDQRIIVLECVCINHIVFCPCPGITCRPQDAAPAAECSTTHSKQKWSDTHVDPTRATRASFESSQQTSKCQKKNCKIHLVRFSRFLCEGASMSCGWARSHRCAKKEPRKTLKDFEQKHHRVWASQTTLRGLENCLATMSNFFFEREMVFMVLF